MPMFSMNSSSSSSNSVHENSVSSSANRDPMQVKTDRDQWNNHCEFFLSSLGLAVGLGNLWRFPFICYINGGGTFLIPYLLSLLFVGLPLFFMEMILGQYAGLSCTKIYSRLAPGLRGMGYGMIAIPTIINFYYTVIMAYSFLYLFMGFTWDLPWSHCNNDFNSIHCYSLTQSKECTAGLETYWNHTCMPIPDFCQQFGHSSSPGYNDSCRNSEGEQVPFSEMYPRTSASEDFWYRRILGLKITNNSHVESSWDSWGSPRWDLIGCLALSWLLICASLIKGIQSYGKVTYFTTLFPYVVLTIMLGYVAQLDGFVDGLLFYVTPQWDKLADIQVWNSAASQIFYSLGVAVGSQLLLSSYNNFEQNAHRDALLIGVCNSLTSLYAGIVVFGVMGFISKEKNINIDQVITAGPGLAFVVYPEAVTLMDIPPLFSFLFFFMLILLSISSLCGSWEAFIASIMDEFPSLKPKRTAVMIVTCIMAFLCGLPICFDSGFLLFQLMDDRCSNAILLLAFVELITVSWFYGTDRFYSHIEDMGMKLNIIFEKYWKICWSIITPIILLVVTCLAWFDRVPDRFLDYEYPKAVQAMGWGIELFAIGIVVIMSIYHIAIKHKEGNDVSFIKPGPMMRPKPSWGPRPDSMIFKTGNDNLAMDH